MGTQFNRPTESDIVVSWDGAPVRQMFGDCRIVLDGVALDPNGRRYRINASANRHGRRVEIVLRYLSESKRGHCVPETHCQLIRSAAQAAALEAIGRFVAPPAPVEEAAPVEAPAPVEFVEIMPQTWESSLGMLLAILEAGDAEGRTMARAELIRMAKVADLAAEHSRKLESIRDATGACDSEIRALASTRGTHSVQAIEARDAFRNLVRNTVTNGEA